MTPTFAAVYFDCDSTLSTIEGVDELLQFADPGLRREIAEMTSKAMNGQLPLAEVYQTRLKQLAPRREQLDLVGAHYVKNLVAHAREVVQALQFVGKHVGIISGGLLLPVQHLARHLGVELANVHAVPLLFEDDGRYRDFDHNSPLWRNGGKIPVVQNVPASHRPLVFVGDGVTDLETQPHVGRFIGFGGVAARDAVRAGAEHYVAAPSLAPILPLVLTREELDRLRTEASFTSLLSAAEA